MLAVEQNPQSGQVSDCKEDNRGALGRVTGNKAMAIDQECHDAAEDCYQDNASLGKQHSHQHGDQE